jgi:hypothetical protein
MSDRLEPDIDMLEIFVDALLRNRGTEGFISLRSFLEHEDKAPASRITPVSLKGNFKFLINCVIDDARRAAQAPKPVVFAPPLCIFNNEYKAGEKDILTGLVISVELDRTPDEALKQLEELLGPATVIVRSGGQWIDGDGEVRDKLHVHWRLAGPARTPDDLTALKAARMTAAYLVGGDGTNNPVCHPIRWPGSWHRKKEPRLCSIGAVRPDVEIKLVDAIAALPPPPMVTKQARSPEFYRTFIDRVHEGSERGGAIATLYGHLVRKNVDAVMALSIARIFDETRNVPPLSIGEVDRICNDIATLERERRRQYERGQS